MRCQLDLQYTIYINRWKLGEVSGAKGEVEVSNHIRRYLHNKYDNKCCQCGWNEINIHTNKVPLEINHKDGNWRNNQESNLDLLCPNCHALTPNHGSRNKGHGRRTFIENKNQSRLFSLPAKHYIVNVK